MYVDFKAILEKSNEKKWVNTIVNHHHWPISYGFVVKASDDIPVELLEEYNIPTELSIYRGIEEEPEVAKRFMEAIIGLY